MTPQFAKAVDPIFIQVIELLERIQQGGNPDPDEEQRLIVTVIDQADRALGRNDDWNLAKYAFACWIDEMLIQAPWTPGSKWWENNPLERMFYGNREAYYRFYARAAEASQLRSRDALEVFYVCAMLGFRGFYQGDPATAAAGARDHGWAATLQEWSDRTRQNIILGHGRADPKEEGEEQPGAPALQGFNFLVWTLMAGVVLAAITVALGVQYVSNSM